MVEHGPIVINIIIIIIVIMISIIFEVRPVVEHGPIVRGRMGQLLVRTGSTVHLNCVQVSVLLLVKF